MTRARSHKAADARPDGLAIRQKLTFLVVGGVSAACYILLAGLLHSFGLTPTVASTIAYVVCIPIGYIGHYLFTFRSTRHHTRASAAYLLVQVCALLVASAATFLFSQVLGLDSTFAFCFAAIAAATLSYLMQRHWVF
jgi:putative flippase GtrA